MLTEIKQQESATSNNELVKEMTEQRAILEAIYENTTKTRRYIMIGKIISFVYLLIVIIPIILATIYLPSIIQNYITPYQELLDGVGQLQVDSGAVSDIIKQINGR
jgi:uncharacterized BrkB/YihY/UPF0761 family membrane protein